MLKIINDLIPFFEDNYKRIHVREYAKLQNISPPTASKLLDELKKQDILKKEIQNKYYYFYSNKNSKDFKDLQRIYYRLKLKNFLEYIEKETINPTIILFGSVAKAETTRESDIDVVIITPTQKKLNTELYEKELNRNIQLFLFKNLKDIPSHLKINILNGYVLRGEL